MVTAGLLSGLVAGTIILIIGQAWSHRLSGAQFRSSERPIALMGSFVVGTSLAFSSLFLLVSPDDAGSELWLQVLAVVAGILAIPLAAAWALGHRRYIDWCIRREPKVFNGRGWADHSRVVWAVARWVPSALLVVGGLTLIIVH